MVDPYKKLEGKDVVISLLTGGLIRVKVIKATPQNISVLDLGTQLNKRIPKTNIEDYIVIQPNT